MNEKQRAQNHHHGGMTLPDFYHVVFRHKWAIIILSVLGFVAAAIIHFTAPTDYISEAELLIKFVRETGAPTMNTGDGQMKSVDASGEGIISTEIAILNSYDLAMQVATNFGPAKILGKKAGPSDTPNDLTIAAANMVRDGLRVERYGKGPVLSITFAHPDFSLVRGLLTEIITDYQNYTIAIHGAAGANYESDQKETEDLRNYWMQAQDELHKAKKDVNVMNIDDSKKYYALTMFQDSQAIKLAQAELADLKDALATLKGTSGTNTSTNKVEIPQETIDAYTDAVELISSLKKAYDKMRDEGMPAHNKLCLAKMEQVEKAKETKKKMEQDEPRLAKLNLSGKVSGEAANMSLAEQITDKETEIQKKEKHIKFAQAEYDENSAALVKLEAAESRILDLEFKEKQTKENYQSFMNKLANSKIDLDLAALKNVNIAVTQQPMPPALERTKTPKKMAVAALSGILVGLAWAFLSEFYLDHSVKRAKEVEGDLGMRLFLSIPKIKRKDLRRNLLKAPKDAPEPEAANGSMLPVVNGANGQNGKHEVAPWDPNHSLHEYYEALRDRLIAYFEVNNLTHKPKLVAVTGASKGAGTTSIAVGLAASLSQTGEGKVLLIDMNYENGGAQPFYQGKPGCELDAALTDSTRETALVQDNLYVVSGPANGDKLARMLPKKFATLVPKFEASNYDYIIFDMPPISRTGVTQRLAGFMDQMLVVVEAEKTSRDVVRQANALLAESKAKVSVVLNKTRTYVPKRLHQEF
jgi:succinoglycan biosynthesis transport protein ExoP